MFEAKSLLSEGASNFIEKLSDKNHNNTKIYSYCIDNEEIKIIIRRKYQGIVSNLDISVDVNNKCVYNMQKEMQNNINGDYVDTVFQNEKFYGVGVDLVHDLYVGEKVYFRKKDIFEANEDNFYFYDSSGSHRFKMVDNLFIDKHNSYFRIYYNPENDEIGLMINNRRYAIDIASKTEKEISDQIRDIKCKYNNDIKIAQQKIQNTVSSILYEEGLTISKRNKEDLSICINNVIHGFFTDLLIFDFTSEYSEYILKEALIIKNAYQEYIKYVNNKELIYNEINNLSSILEKCDNYEANRNEYEKELEQKTVKLKEKLKKKYGIV